MYVASRFILLSLEKLYVRARLFMHVSMHVITSFKNPTGVTGKLRKF